MVGGAIGIDIGGTSVRIGIIGTDGRLQNVFRFPTSQILNVNGPEGRKYEFLMANLKSQISDIRFQTSLKSQISNPESETLWPRNVGSPSESQVPIGLAVPGVIDAQAGIVRRSVNLPFLENRPIARDLSKAIQDNDPPIPNSVVIMTDADAATWGEYFAFTPDQRRFAHLRIGTGIALGIVTDGKLLPRDPNRRTHLPILVVDHSSVAKQCPCGLRGCLETICSGPAIISQACELLGATNLAEVEQASAQGNSKAMELITHCASAIRAACGAICREFKVDVVSLGGGVMNALPSLQRQLTNPQVTSDSNSGGPMLIPAVLGDDAGVVGAALLAAVQT